MTRELWIAFAAFFGAGPAIYAWLLRYRGTWVMPVLTGLCVACFVYAAVDFERPEAGDTGLPAPLLTLTAMWLAWIFALVSLVSALMKRTRAIRGLYITGLLATTLPWFGLATARMMAM